MANLAVSTPSADSLVLCTHSFNKYFLSSSWVSVTVLPHGAAAIRQALPLHSLWRSWGECSQPTLFHFQGRIVLNLCAALCCPQSYHCVYFQWHHSCNLTNIPNSLPCMFARPGLQARRAMWLVLASELWVWHVLLLGQRILAGFQTLQTVILKGRGQLLLSPVPSVTTMNRAFCWPA